MVTSFMEEDQGETKKPTAEYLEELLSMMTATDDTNENNRVVDKENEVDAELIKNCLGVMANGMLAEYFSSAGWRSLLDAAVDESQ